MRVALALLLAPAVVADELTARVIEEVPVDECMNAAVPCPTIAGRYLTIDGGTVALVDRTAGAIDTLFCERDADRWRCRYVTVVRRQEDEIAAADLLRRVASARRVAVQEDFGQIPVPDGRPPTCGEDPARACEVQSVRLYAGVPGDRASRSLHRVLWLVDQDTLLRCSDESLRACDRMTAAAWVALIVSLRPSASSPPLPEPELGPIDVRPGRPAGETRPRQGAARGAGAPAAWVDGAGAPGATAGAEGLPDRPPEDAQGWLDDARDGVARCLRRGAELRLRVTFRADGAVAGYAAERDPPRGRVAACVGKALGRLRAAAARQGPYVMRVTVSRALSQSGP